jgi:LCP family protein required for cell wall assembly
MEQVQRSNSKSLTNSTGLLVGVAVALAVVVLEVGLVIYRGVSNFVARWQITDLPGMVLTGETGADPEAVDPQNPEAVPQVPVPQSESGLLPPAWDEASRFNLLAMGLDYRDWEAGEGAPRTDTMILLSVDPVSKTAGMLSIPRDLWVSLPGFQDPERINTAYRFGETYELPGGGPELAMATVENLLGLKIDYYALIDFASFEKFIDEIGGVKIDIPKKIKVDPINGETTVLRKGEQVLPGSLALAYARARYTEGGDFDRARRTQQVIMGIRNRIINANALPGLIARAPAMFEQLSSGITTNLGLNEAIQLAVLAQQIPEENIKQGVIGTEQVTFAEAEGDKVNKPRPEQVRILRDEIFTSEGAASPIMADSTIEELVKAENASVSVLNGSGTPGLASHTADYLKSLGVNVVSTGDAPEQTIYSTVISHTGNPYTLKYLVDLMAIPEYKIFNRFDPASPVEIELILGADWANSNTMP